jgi:hypothetical protein
MDIWLTEYAVSTGSVFVKAWGLSYRISEKFEGYLKKEFGKVC